MSAKFPVSLRRLAVAYFLLVTLLVAGTATAESPRPVQLSLWDPLQLVESERSVTGFRMSLLRVANRDVTGLDVSGLIGSTLGTQRGVQLGVWSVVKGDLVGAQLVLGGVVEGRMRGLQLGAGSFADDSVGVQIGAANSAKQVLGLQLGLAVNTVDERGRGLQAGAVWNRAKRLSGLQFGLIRNQADELVGVQTGLINISKNGFVPIFPLFNFAL